MADKEKERAVRGVDSVTDYVEEKEIGNEEMAKASLSGLTDESLTPIQLVISQQDIMIVAEECEVSKEKAETLLRKNRGQVKEAIQSYVRGL